LFTQIVETPENHVKIGVQKRKRTPSTKGLALKNMDIGIVISESYSDISESPSVINDIKETKISVNSKNQESPNYKQLR
jgi:capsular polysaccharide biosynthesis protein